MYNARDEGLGLSLFVYTGVLAVALVLILTPVLWAQGPKVYDNPELPKYDITSSRSLAHQQKQVPLARLKREEIVDAKMLAAVNARPEGKPQRVREARSERPNRVARTAYAQAHDDEAPRPRRGLFGWSLF